MANERPAPADEAVRDRMAHQKRQDTKPEVVLRKRLHARGYRFRVAYPVPGMPRRTIDIAFPRRRVAVLVDGCFWHACPTRGVKPKNNKDWWADKLAGNRARDLETTEALTDLGWTVVRVWEHEPPEVARREGSSISP